MKKTPFTGSGVAIVTPFKDGKVNYEKLGELLEFQIANSTDAIIVCGTTGEAATLTEEEHIGVTEYAVSKVGGRIPVICGAGSNNTAHAISLVKGAEKVKADALLIVTPYYNKTSQKGIIEYYSTLAKSTSLPVIVYNVPGRTGVNILPETLFELSKIENIVAIKEASGNISQVSKMAKLCGDDIAIYSGDDDLTLPILSLGGKGVISVLANICPKETHELVASYLSGDTETSRKLQLRFIDLIAALFIEVNPMPVKTAMNLIKMDVGEVRPPLCEMESKNIEILKSILVKYGFTV